MWNGAFLFDISTILAQAASQTLLTTSSALSMLWICPTPAPDQTGATSRSPSCWPFASFSLSAFCCSSCNHYTHLRACAHRLPKFFARPSH